MSFDVTAFLDTTTDESNSTKTTPVPEGEYPGIISKIAARQWSSKDGTSSGTTLDVFWSIEDEQVRVELDRKEVICKQGVMLDITADMKIDTGKGKNIQLGKLREAVGLNKRGQSFSFNMLPGCQGIVTVSHRIEGEDTYSEIKKVRPM